MRQNPGWVTISPLLFAVTACTVQLETGYSATKADGLEAGRVFHQRFSEQRLEDIYDATHEAFRATASKAAILAQMRANREQYGAFISSDERGAYCQLQDVEVWYHSRYVNSSVTEGFRWHMRGRVPELVSYRASQGLAEPQPELGSPCP